MDNHQPWGAGHRSLGAAVDGPHAPTAPLAPNDQTRRQSPPPPPRMSAYPPDATVDTRDRRVSYYGAYPRRHPPPPHRGHERRYDGHAGASSHAASPLRSLMTTTAMTPMHWPPIADERQGRSRIRRIDQPIDERHYVPHTTNQPPPPPPPVLPSLAQAHQRHHHHLHPRQRQPSYPVRSAPGRDVTGASWGTPHPRDVVVYPTPSSTSVPSLPSSLRQRASPPPQWSVHDDHHRPWRRHRGPDVGDAPYRGDFGGPEFWGRADAAARASPAATTAAATATTASAFSNDPLTSEAAFGWRNSWDGEGSSRGSPSRSQSSSVGDGSPVADAVAPTAVAASSSHAPPTGMPKANGQRLPVTAPTKPSRYLRELDRRIILSRIAKGERQSALAKEYKVSRSTICNLYKHRAAVLSRSGENPLSRHPKKARLAAQRHHAPHAEFPAKRHEGPSASSPPPGPNDDDNNNQHEEVGGRGGDNNSPTAVHPRTASPVDTEPPPSTTTAASADAVASSTSTATTTSADGLVTTTQTPMTTTNTTPPLPPTITYFGFDYATIVEVQSKAVALLMSRVQHPATPALEFERAMNRVLRLLLEEALAIVVGTGADDDNQQQPHHHNRHHQQPRGQQQQQHEDPAAARVDLCAVSMMAPDMCPLLGAFRHLEPTQAIARVQLPRGLGTEDDDHGGDHGDLGDDKRHHRRGRAIVTRAPGGPPLGELEVLLLDVVASTGPGMCAAIEALLERGARPDRLTIVALFVAPEVIALVQYAFPRVRIITARIDAQLHSRQDRRDPQRSSPPSLAVLDRLRATLRRMRL